MRRQTCWPLFCPGSLQGQQPPPIAFLRHPRVFDVLLQGLFNPARQLQPETVQAYSGLLALAAAADDRRQLPGGSAPAQAAAPGSDGDPQQQQQQPDGGGGGTLDLSAVAATRAALESAAELAQRVMQDQKSRPEDLETAAAVLEYPCCAAGTSAVWAWVCGWARGGAGPEGSCREEASSQPAVSQPRHAAWPIFRQPLAGVVPSCQALIPGLPPRYLRAGLLRALGAQLTRPEYWQTAYHLLKSPPFLSILSLLVPRQPALHDSLLRLLGGALGALGNSNHDMAKGFLSIAVQVF